MEGEQGLVYQCTNDECPRYLSTWKLWAEAGEALCPSCGWFMSAVYD